MAAGSRKIKVRAGLDPGSGRGAGLPRPDVRRPAETPVVRSVHGRVDREGVREISPCEDRNASLIVTGVRGVTPKTIAVLDALVKWERGGTAAAPLALACEASSD